MTTFDETTLVRVRNDSDKPFQGKFNNRDYLIPVGGEIIVPYYAATHWFGDNSLVDTDRNRARVDEYQRIRMKYGAYDDPKVWEANRPRATVTDVSTGQEIPLFIDDPEGRRVTQAFQSQTDQTDLEARLAALEDEASRLRAAQVSAPTPEPIPAEIEIGDSGAVGGSGAVPVASEPEIIDSVPEDVEDIEPLREDGLDEDVPEKPKVSNVE